MGRKQALHHAIVVLIGGSKQTPLQSSKLAVRNWHRRKSNRKKPSSWYV